MPRSHYHFGDTTEAKKIITTAHFVEDQKDSEILRTLQRMHNTATGDVERNKTDMNYNVLQYISNGLQNEDQIKIIQYLDKQLQIKKNIAVSLEELKDTLWEYMKTKNERVTIMNNY